MGRFWKVMYMDTFGKSMIKTAEDVSLNIIFNVL